MFSQFQFFRINTSMATTATTHVAVADNLSSVLMELFKTAACIKEKILQKGDLFKLIATIYPASLRTYKIGEPP